MKKKHQRLILIIISLSLMGVALAIILSQLKDSMVFFYSPTELSIKEDLPDSIIRIGGMVAKNSIKKYPDNQYEFVLTDYESSITVKYQGILPTLFREEQGIIAQGRLLNKQVFDAKTLLAKHDENYMPPEVAKTLKIEHKGNIE